MNRCPKCGETSEPQFDACWKCGIDFAAQPLPDVADDFGGTTAPRRRPVARYRHFRGTFTSWPSLLKQAADFASEIGPGRLITISHSEDKDDGLVVVWYWSDPETDDDTA